MPGNRLRLTVGAGRDKVRAMRILALVALLAAVLAWPPASYAQQQQNQSNGWQLHDPNEYQQEDSHPVRAIASLLSPIGWALEWGVARPWHYVATNTFLAPVLNGGQHDDTWSEYYGTPGPMAEVPIPQPPVTGPGASSQPPLREQNLGPASAPPTVSSSGSTTSSHPPVGAPPYPQNTQGQAILH
jgi:hypothetical protein